ncbi:hypothetical protein FQR65_LT16261 [Abscondita terminalis]|nr:hypothetical protein FQR65_LT16261 [Abscondita terminalis]
MTHVLKLSSLNNYFIDDMQLLERGENAVESGHVTNMIFNDELKKISGSVNASMKNKLYKVEIMLDNDRNIIDSYCACPRGRVICHHIAALALFAHYNISSTDKSCSWSVKKNTASEKVQTIEDLFPTSRQFIASKSLPTQNDVTEFYNKLKDLGGNVGVQFADSDGGNVAVINSKWFTPMKREVFWPPYKTQHHYDNALKKGETPTDSWPLYKISRTFFECDDFYKAQRKIKLAEVTSDIQSEEDNFQSKRFRHAPRRLYDSSDDEDQTQISRHPRPPFISYNKQPNRNFQRKGICDVTAPTLCSKTNQDFSQTPCTSADALTFDRPIPTGDNQILHSDLPVNLPIKTEEDVKNLELHLIESCHSSALRLYLSTLGGKDVVSRTNNILKRCLTNSISTKFNYYGKRNLKLAFSNLKLNKVIIDAVKISSHNAAEYEIENCIKAWLKHAPQRLKAEELKQSRSVVTP